MMLLFGDLSHSWLVLRLVKLLRTSDAIWFCRILFQTIVYTNADLSKTRYDIQYNLFPNHGEFAFVKVLIILPTGVLYESYLI